ncbi:LysR family transcriptional regulator [Blautia sp. OF09-25XD]|uniref:LysR family transcriptional regulator n=1 Tax=Blautia sp. OF09-25XD TaxID=2292981 RepID=UPI001FA97D38|nr:LysR family transcriptional regulator [Blautia sp. OF09-25XD]
MNIEYLKYFAELAKLQHYGKAAKALNISQPGLSHAIKTLEDEYGVPLFQKEGRNVSLSRYGKELMQDVEEILDAYLRMEERAAGLGRKKRQCGSEPYIRSRQEQYHICCGNSARPSRLSSITA